MDNIDVAQLKQILESDNTYSDSDGSDSDFDMLEDSGELPEINDPIIVLPDNKYSIQSNSVQSNSAQTIVDKQTEVTTVPDDSEVVDVDDLHNTRMEYCDYDSDDDSDPDSDDEEFLSADYKKCCCILLVASLLFALIP